MNISRIPNLRAEEEFSKEYRALSLLIGNLEERSESIALDKKREQDNKKVDLFDVNKSISNQIQETNKDLEKKLMGNLNFMDDLETNVEGLKRNTTKLISEYKKAINDLATKKTEDLIDNKVRDQIANAKNLFFKKVLREIVVGNEKAEDVIRVLESKIALKEKLLKKALLGAEHFRISIEKVENKYIGLKKKDEDYFKKISNSLCFGHVKISDDLNTIEARKLFSRDFRGEKGIRESLAMKDRLLLIENDRICAFDGITANDPLQSINFTEIKEINLIKEEPDINYNLGSMDMSDPNKISTIFFVKYRNERGGFIIETDSTTAQKWDYQFFIVNLIVANNITYGLNFKPLTLESNTLRLLKQIVMKSLDPIIVKKQLPFNYSYPMEDNKQVAEVEDTLIDWEILERIASRENDNLVKRVMSKTKSSTSTIEISQNSKSSQTDMIRSSDVDEGIGMANAGGIMISSKGANQAQLDPRYRTQEFNYQIPSLSSFVKDADLLKSKWIVYHSLWRGGSQH